MTARREPVLLAFLTTAVPILAAFALQVLDLSGIATPLWARTILTGLGTVVGLLAAAWARSNVTPVPAASREAIKAKVTRAAKRDKRGRFVDGYAEGGVLFALLLVALLALLFGVGTGHYFLLLILLVVIVLVLVL